MLTYTFRIYPTEQQQSKLWQHSIALNRLHNKLIEIEEQNYREGNKFLTQYDLQNLLPEFKQTDVISEHLKNIHSQVIQQVAYRIALAYKAFFKKNSAHPKFRSCRYFYTLCYPQNGYSINKHHINTKVYGSIKTIFHRNLKGTVKTLSISQNTQGQWYVYLVTDYTPPKNTAKGYCGIDLGITNLVTTSNGEVVPNLEDIKYFDKQINAVKSKRDLLYKKGSRNFRRMSKIVGKLHGVKCRKTSDYLHKVSKDLSSKYGVIAIEDLNVKQMSESKITGINREIRNSSWNRLIQYLSYKCNYTLHINPYNTSKTCNVCGHVHSKMPLHIRTYKCPTCLNEQDRDLNAAINIATLGIAMWTSRTYNTKVTINDIDIQLYRCLIPFYPQHS